MSKNTTISTTRTDAILGQPLDGELLALVRGGEVPVLSDGGGWPSGPPCPCGCGATTYNCPCI